MAYGQPFYQYTPMYQPNANSGTYVAPQPSNYNNCYPPQFSMPQMAQNQPSNGFQQPTGQIGQQQPPQGLQTPNNSSQQGFPIKDIRFVTSDEAKAFIVMPNSNALLIDTINGMAYFKSADSVGQSFTESYKFVKVLPESKNVQPEKAAEQQKSNGIDLSEFVKKQDIVSYIDKSGFVTKEQYNALQDQLDNLKKQISANSSNKKQTAQKDET